MAITQINEYGSSNTDIVNLQTTVDSQRIGYFQGSLTEWDTSTVPEIAAGTVFENNGALWEITTDTSIGGSPSDGKVYIYFDCDTPAFTFTNTAPTWSDSKQGWYGTSGTVNYRYIPFIMTKATTNYTDKRVIIVNNQTNRTTLEDGADADNELFFASDASIEWDESEDYFILNKKIKIVSTKYGYTGALGSSFLSFVAGVSTENNVFDGISPYLDTNTTVMATGEYGSDPIFAVAKGTTSVYVYYGSSGGSKQFDDGVASTIPADFSIYF